MHVTRLFENKHNTLRKKWVFAQGYLCSIYMFTLQKKASISTLFRKVDLKNGGEEGSHELFYLI